MSKQFVLLGPTPAPGHQSLARSARFPMLLLSLLAMGLVLGGWAYLTRVQNEARGLARAELLAIADLKRDQIHAWRQERLADAQFFSRAQFVARDLQRLVDDPASREAQAAVLNWLNLLQGGGRYREIFIYSLNGDRLMALPDSAQVSRALILSRIGEVVRTRGCVISDLYRDTPDGVVEMDVAFPVFENANVEKGKPLAVVLIKLEARRFLFPLIQSWPTPSRTAETLLVRLEGNEVVYLNDLRHRTNTALTFRVPLTSMTLPAARALRGETGAIDGVDYRGVPVVAASRRIPGTPWAIVSKIDKAEVYASLHQRVRIIILLLATMLLASALLVGILWRQRKNNYLRRELALEKERSGLAERLAHLMRHANDIILLVRPDGRILEANDCALESYGFTASEMRAKRVHDLRPTSGVEVPADYYLAQVNATGSLTFETVHQRKNGTALPVEVRSRKISVQGEELILSIVRDITERKAHEREIDRLNRLYAARSEVSQAIVRASTPQRLLDDVCRVLVQFGGFEMAWVAGLGDPGEPLIPLARFGDEAGYLQEIRVFADERREGCGPVGTAIREERPCVANDIQNDPRLLPWRKALERSGWRSMAAFPIRQEGRVCGALIVYAQHREFFGQREQSLVEQAAADLSYGLDTLRNDQRRHQAEEQLRLQAAALHSAANGILIAGRDGVIQWVNPALERLTGYTAAEVIGQTPRLLSSGHHDKSFFRNMWTTVLAGNVWRGEVVNKRKDGSLYTEEMTVTPVKDSQGQITHFIAIKQDVTARKQAEEALAQVRDQLAQANTDLEQRVQERTAQLRETIAELESFSYSLSHDLRAPLRAIHSFTSLALEEDNLGADSVALLGKVMAAARRMDQLVNDILALSHISQTHITVQPLDTEKLARQIVQERPELQLTNAVVEIESPLARVVGHEASLTQCLSNLFANAVKFIAPGVKPHIRVYTEKQGDKVRLWIADNGIGIPQDSRHRIFEIFHRLHGHGNYEGTGIGLAIVKKAVERMQGSVGVESVEGQGSRFWLELPSPGDSPTQGGT